MVGPLALLQAFNNRSFFVTTVEGNNQGDILADRFFRSIAEQSFCALIPTGDYAIQIFAHNRIVRRFHNGSQQTGRLLSPLALGDVHRCTDVFQEIPGYVANGVPCRANVLNRSVWKNDSELRVELGVFVQPVKNRFSAYPVSILWMNALVKPI